MDVQELADYEAAFQFALGDILRDLAILMRYTEQGQPCDEATYSQVLQHIQTFKDRLSALEQDLHATQQPINTLADSNNSSNKL